MTLPLVCGFAAFPQSPAIAVRVYTQPEVSAGILTRGEQEAAALLESGGIKTVWMDCSRPGICDHDLAADELIMCLRPPTPPKRARGDRSAVLGSAAIGTVGTGVAGWVNYELLQMVATREGVDPAMLLAYVLAHEIGHLLGAVHDSMSLMHGRWGAREMRMIPRNYLHFNQKQRNRMQAEVWSRIRTHRQRDALLAAAPPQR